MASGAGSAARCATMAATSMPYVTARRTAPAGSTDGVTMIALPSQTVTRRCHGPSSSSQRVCADNVQPSRDTMSSELANALGNPVPLPRTEDSNYDDTLELKHDPDAEDVKPPTENEDVHGSHGEEEMEDLFGDDKDAEEVRHDG